MRQKHILRIKLHAHGVHLGNANLMMKGAYTVLVISKTFGCKTTMMQAIKPDGLVRQVATAFIVSRTAWFQTDVRGHIIHRSVAVTARRLNIVIFIRRFSNTAPDLIVGEMLKDLPNAQAMKWQRDIKVALPLAIIALFLFGQALNRYYSIFHEFETALLSIQWILLVCIVIWCGSFISLTFNLNDLPLISLFFISILAFFIGYAAIWPTTGAINLLVGMTLGRGVRLFFIKWKAESGNFLIGLVVLLTFSSWWHLNTSTNFYHVPRWKGLWNNPNDYGMLMGMGLLLAIGLLAQRQKEELKMKKLLPVALLVSAGMMAVGLVFSYSRGSWFGAAAGLIYLAKAHGKFKWRFVLPGILIVAAVFCFFWNATPDDASWYMKRMDFGRPSAQHRVAAWKAGFEMMLDHPFGVGWNKAVEIYVKDYSPPQNGAAAMITNDYLMLGTELGLPALLCFIAYIYLKFKQKAADSLQVACRAGALVLLVAFWFDGGLFTLATAAVFWILLELGTSPSQQTGISGKQIEPYASTAG
jgi:O-Antigen ligase